MRIIDTPIPEVRIIEPRVFEDERGFFLESFHRRRYAEQAGIAADFVQDNHSHSRHAVLRGIHYQLDPPQAKLVRAVTGEVFDVAVDLRRASPTFGRWAGVTLSAANRRQLWIPEGFGHAFLVLTEVADVFYKMSGYYSPAGERCIAWNDPDIGIEWPLPAAPVVSAKDRAGVSLAEAEVFP